MKRRLSPFPPLQRSITGLPNCPDGALSSLIPANPMGGESKKRS